ncbi:MAG TPA: hypothetical protein VK862_16440 [Afifellaceae bacterium]|nr:hypothetical protein [Afifellaceae bacterium]
MALPFVSFRTLLLCAALSGCAGSQAVTGALQEPAAEPAQSPERAAAVAEIRQKAEAAAAQQTGEAPDVYQTHGPATVRARSYGEVKAIEAELRAIAEASKRPGSVAELEALRRRAAYLEELRRKSASDLDESPNTGSITQ